MEEPSPTPTPEPDPSPSPEPEPTPEPTPEPAPVEPTPGEQAILEALAGIHHSIDLLLVVALTFSVLAIFALAVVMVKAIR